MSLSVDKVIKPVDYYKTPILPHLYCVVNTDCAHKTRLTIDAKRSGTYLHGGGLYCLMS